jgi:uncharacterized protein
MMVETSIIEAFVAPFYAGKDTMHDLSHVRRILKAVNRLIEPYRGSADEELIACAVYFHGIIREHQEAIIQFLRLSSLAEDRVRQIVQVAQESLKDAEPSSLEGKILHDAHLTEGGTSFLIVKSLMTGAARGQSLAQTLDFFEKKILGRFRCYLPEAQARYDEQTTFARQVLADLRANAALDEQI